MDSYDIHMLIQEVYDELKARRVVTDSRLLNKLSEVLEVFEEGDVRTDKD